MGHEGQAFIMQDTRLLDMSAPAAACAIALRWLDKAVDAGQRFAGSEDEEALHDFRVALRRLRATERSYRELLSPAIPKKLRRALRELTQASNLARDTEVQLEWLEAQQAALRPHQRAGYQWLHRHLRTRVMQEYAVMRERVEGDFPLLEQRLRERLHVGATMPGSPLAVAAETALRALLDELVAAVARLDEACDMPAIHALRLIAKRARYLLDPLADDIDAAAVAARELAAIQGLLGDIHDRQVMRQELFAAAGAAGAERFRAVVELAASGGAESPELRHARRRSESAGLVALVLRVAEQERELLAKLHARIERGGLDAMLKLVATALAAIADLAAAATPAPASAES
jgi:CHAD domain-containing protein